MVTLIRPDSPADQITRQNADVIRETHGTGALVDGLKISFEVDPDIPGVKPILNLPEVGLMEQIFTYFPEFGAIKVPAEIGDTLEFLGKINNVYPAIVAEDLFEKTEYRYDLIPDQDNTDLRNLAIVAYEFGPKKYVMHSLYAAGIDFPLIFTEGAPTRGEAFGTECFVTEAIQEEMKLEIDENLTKSYIESGRGFWAEDKSNIVVFISAVIQNS